MKISHDLTRLEDEDKKSKPIVKKQKSTSLKPGDLSRPAASLIGGSKLVLTDEYNEMFEKYMEGELEEHEVRQEKERLELQLMVQQEEHVRKEKWLRLYQLKTGR